VGECYIQVWALDNGRVPFPSIITVWGGGTLWAINWRWGNGVPLYPITLQPLGIPPLLSVMYRHLCLQWCWI